MSPCFWRSPLEERQIMVLRCQILNTLFSRNCFHVNIRKQKYWSREEIPNLEDRCLSCEHFLMPGAAPGVMLWLSDEAKHNSRTSMAMVFNGSLSLFVSMTSAQRFFFQTHFTSYHFLKAGGRGRISNAILCLSQY